jgi:hypothetical protein
MHDNDVNEPVDKTSLVEEQIGGEEKLVGRPDYDLAYDLVHNQGHKSTPVPDGSDIANLWHEAHIDLDDALLTLIPKNGFGKTVLNPKNTRAEEKRLGKALDLMHDFLRLYKEVIRKQPPEPYTRVEQILSNRHIALKQINSPQP